MLSFFLFYGVRYLLQYENIFPAFRKMNILTKQMRNYSYDLYVHKCISMNLFGCIFSFFKLKLIK